MKESIGENNLMDLRASLKVQKTILYILIIYMLFRLLFYSYFNSINIDLIKNIISLFDLTAGALFTSLVYETAKKHLEFTWAYEDLYKEKIKKLNENKVKLKILESSLLLSNDNFTLLSSVNEYYTYAVSNDLYSIYSRDKFINFIDNTINRINASNTTVKRNKLKREIVKELTDLNNDTIESLTFFLYKGKKLRHKYKF